MRRRLPLSSTLFDKDAHYTAHSLHIARYHRRCYCRYFYYCIALCSNKNDRRGVGRVTYGTASARHLLDSPTTITYVPSRRRPIIITCITSCASRRPLSSLRNVSPTSPHPPLPLQIGRNKTERRFGFRENNRDGELHRSGHDFF